MLTNEEHAILEFEKRTWRHEAHKTQASEELFGLSATAYYQVLFDIIQRPETIAAEPMLVRRLRKLVAQKQRARSARARARNQAS